MSATFVDAATRGSTTVSHVNRSFYCINIINWLFHITGRGGSAAH